MSTEIFSTDIRSRFIEATIRLLAKSGPSEVKARPVATEAGLSTMGVYNYFGGVQGLLQAVADEGFKRQAAAFSQVVNTNDPMTDLCMMAFACRNFAFENPHLYDLMFGLSILGRYSPTRGTATHVLQEFSPSFNVSYAYLHRGCARLIEDNCGLILDPDLIALQFWSTLHGFIMLELGGHFTDRTNPSLEILMPLCINLVVGLGAERGKAERSAASAISKWEISHP